MPGQSPSPERSRRLPDIDVDINVREFKLSDLIDPMTLVAKLMEAYRAWRGYRLLVLGAKGVGKTTLWTYLETGRTGVKVESTRAVAPVGGDLEHPFFRIVNVKAMGVSVGVKALDVPGDPQLRETWQAAFRAIRPQGVLFLIDHDAGADQVAAPGYTAERMAEHATAFEDMRTIVLGDSEIRDTLRSIVVLANKHDAWHHQLSYGKLAKSAGIHDLAGGLAGGGLSQGIRYNYCSALNGDNVREQVRAMIRGL